MLDTQTIMRLNLDVEAVIEVSAVVFENMQVLVLAIVLIRSTLFLFHQKNLVITPTKLTQIKRQRSKIVLKVLKAGRICLIFL